MMIVIGCLSICLPDVNSYVCHMRIELQGILLAVSLLKNYESSVCHDDRAVSLS